MMWTPVDLKALRDTSVHYLYRNGMIDDNQRASENLFTCDTCTSVEDCEWAFHFENTNPTCVKEEIISEHEESMV